MSAGHRQKLSHDEYLALEQRTGVKHEFFGGEAWAMAGGTPAHAELAFTVGVALRALIGDGRCRVYSSDLKLRVVATGLDTYADAVVVCGPRETAPDDPNAVTNPTVIVEVLSDSTERYDRGVKFESYRQIPTLRAYVLVSQWERRIEVLTRDGENWLYTQSVEGGTVPLASLGGAIPVDAVYDGVELTG